MKIDIINGPNLNLLGTREPGKYGNTSFSEYFDKLKIKFPDINFSYFQSNIEGELIDRIHLAGRECDAIVLNAGGYTHTSVAIHDAIAAVKAPVAEVHITNIYAREEFRHKSLISANCRGTVSGFGLDSYRLAVEALIEILKSKI